MNQIRDFSNTKNFPGTTGNQFDVILHRYASLQKLPDFAFFLLLVVLASVTSGFNWPRAALLMSFFLADWLLLALLPRFKRSYGPPKPPALVLAILRIPFAWLPLPFFVAAEVIGVLLVIYGFWIEPHRLKVTYQRLESPLLKNGAVLRLLHIGDLHVERLTGREHSLIHQVKALQPDLILFSGDVLNLSYLHDEQARADARHVLSRMTAPLGTFAVPGSPAVDLAEHISDIYEGLPVRLLQDERVSLDSPSGIVDVVGLNCTHKPFVDAPQLHKLVSEQPNRFSILLYHSPDLAPDAASAGYHLHLAGHTHGGQVQLPLIGPLFTASLYGRQFANGRYSIGPLTLYITRGIGLEGAGAPRVRFLCSPEIILWELTGSNHAGPSA